MKLMKLCMAAAFMAAASASAQIIIIQAEDAVTLGLNYVSVADINEPPDAFGTNYITSTTTKAGDAPETLQEVAIYEIGNLSSNMQYDLYLRLHVGPGTYNDDSIFIADGFVTNAFNMANQIAGKSGLDGTIATAAGFHWVKVNGDLLSWRGPYFSEAGTNLMFALAPREDGLDVDALAFVTAGLPVTDEMLNPTNSGVAIWSVGSQPNAPTTDSTPDIQAFFADGAETVNTTNISMSLNGETITGFTSSYSNFITTINYTPTTPLDAGATYTAQVVVASSPSGTLCTNAWTFDIQAFPLIYVDAAASNTIMSTSISGPVEGGTDLVTSPDMLADGIWRFRTGLGVAPSVTNGPTGTIQTDSGTLFESSGYDAAAVDNVPRLRTSVSNLVEHTYGVYIYFWNASASFCVRAGLEDTEGIDSLQHFDPTSPDVVQVGVDSGGRTLHRAFLGYVTGTSIDVFLEDLPPTGSQDRTWYDGIGYQQTDGPTGPTMDPVIQSISVSGGTVTLTWTSETIGTYSILNKTSLNNPDWTVVKTGIDGGATTTTDSVPVSGADAEFFSIKGE